MAENPRKTSQGMEKPREDPEKNSASAGKKSVTEGSSSKQEKIEVAASKADATPGEGSAEDKDGSKDAPAKSAVKGTDGGESAEDAQSESAETAQSATQLSQAGDAAKQRATRSRNPEFAARHKNFIKDVKRSMGEKRPSSEEDVAAKKRRRSHEASAATGTGAATNDNFCWVCHRDGRVVCCETCPRVFHLKCAGLSADPPGDWVCVECRRVVQAEAVENLSPAMKMLTHERFTLLLKHAIGRLKGLPGAEPFITPVDPVKFPSYDEVVACPMDLSTMEGNLDRAVYGSTEAFVADCKWILHNCILFNGTNSKLTGLAKSLLRMCKWEMEEIETCPDCYSNAYNSDNWFTEACPQPHLLIWARLKGFPYWPAKAVKSKDGNVDCRFFGRHDRAWVPIKECYLFSREPPSPPKNRSKSLDASIEELEEHVRNLEAAFGSFVYPAPRTLYDARNVRQQLKMMLPGYHCATAPPGTKQKRKSSAAGGKSSAGNGGEKARPSKRPSSAGAASAGAVRGTPPPAQKAARSVKSEAAPVAAEKRPPAAESPSVTDRPEAAPTPPQQPQQQQEPHQQHPQEEEERAPAAASPGPAQLLRVPVTGTGAMKVLPASALRTLSVVQTPQGTLKKVIKLDGSPVSVQQLQLLPMRGGGQPATVTAGAHTPTVVAAARPRLTTAREAGAGSPVAVGRARSSPVAAPVRRPTTTDNTSFTISAPASVGPMMLVPGRAVAPVEAAPAETPDAGQPATPSNGQLAAQDSSLSELIQAGLDSALTDLERAGAPAAALSGLRLQLERLQWRHQMQLAEQRKVTETMLAELRNSMEIEQKKAVNRLMIQMATERAQWARQTELSVAETKRKQWCAACGNEAIFYCCWNTSYCDFPCQEAQWPKHMLTCANQQGAEELAAAPPTEAAPAAADAAVASDGGDSGAAPTAVASG